MNTLLSRSRSWSGPALGFLTWQPDWLGLMGEPVSAQTVAPAPSISLAWWAFLGIALVLWIG